MSDLEIELQGETLLLLPERALYRPRQQTLVIADPHLGKAAAFRAAAIPVPGGTTAANLERLAAAIARTGAQRLICLGDLLHARSGRAAQTVTAVAAWSGQHPTWTSGWCAAITIVTPAIHRPNGAYNALTSR